jgi:hypothetical protein
MSLLSAVAFVTVFRSQLHMAHEFTCRCLATSGPETTPGLHVWNNDYSSLLPVLR